MIAADAVAGNGTIRVRVPGNRDGELFTVVAEGAKAGLSEEVNRALGGQLTAGEATPRTAVAVYAGVLAAETKVVIKVTAEIGRVCLAGRLLEP